MRIAFFGDVVGRSGREGLAEHLPALRRALGLDFVVVNAENAAAGFGITESTARDLFAAGADCLTLGNHAWDQKEALTYIVREHRLLRPLNYPPAAMAPGRGSQLLKRRVDAGCSCSVPWGGSTWALWMIPSPRLMRSSALVRLAKRLTPS